jgi:hypothetical protein
MTLPLLKHLNSQANGPRWVLSDPAFNHVRLSYIPDIDRQLADLARNMLPKLLAVVEAAEKHHVPHCNHCELCEALSALETP